MTKKNNSKGKVPSELRVMEKLTLVEQFLAKLKIDVESSGFRRNHVVENGITSGLNEIDDAVEHLSNEEFQEADLACRIAWLHAHFARGIFDAETTEHYLGEGVFLELDDESIGKDWRKFAVEEISDLEEELVKLRKQIKEKSTR